MIEKVISQSRTTEVDAISAGLMDAYQNSDLSSDEHLNTMFTTLDTQQKQLSAAIMRTRAESELETKDEVRDNTLRNLYMLIKGYTHHPDPAIRAAALKLEKIIDKYGANITNEGYASESSLVNSLLGDFAAAEVQPLIALLSGCAEILATLQADQAAFETARIAYETEKGREGSQANATTLKNAVLDTINKRVVVYLRAMELVEEPVYGEFARTVATLIADNNIVVRKRRSKEPGE
jgi:hypothetical protein